MSATIKLTLSDYSVRERLDGWWRIPTVAQYLYPNGETQQFMNMLDELDGVVHDTEAQYEDRFSFDDYADFLESLAPEYRKAFPIALDGSRDTVTVDGRAFLGSVRDQRTGRGSRIFAKVNSRLSQSQVNADAA